MISDEMRELLSTYVDGELKDSDAARVEDMAKRDPELRREIDAYRILRRQLKEWDEAEHGVEPPETLKSRALARARGYANELREAARGRIVRLVLGPAAMAAGIALAAFVGLQAAGTGEPDAIALEAKSVLPREGLAPYVSYDVAGEVKLDAPAPLPEFRPVAPIFRDELHNRIVDGRLMSDKALQFMIDWTEQRDQLRGIKSKRKPETVTGTWKPEVLAMVRGYKPADAPFEGLVVLGHQTAITPPEMPAIPAGESVASERAYGHEDENRLMIDTAGRKKKQNLGERLLLAGEVFVGTKDGSNRVRLVSGTSWIKDETSVPMTWADDKPRPQNDSYLTLQGEMLGPEARRRLVMTAGRNENFRNWLEKSYGSDLAKAFATGRRQRQKAVDRLVGALRRNLGATGFAVVADGKLLGLELFASHELMLDFAPRLLHGYLMEAGTKSISLESPSKMRANDRLTKLAQALMDQAAQTAVRAERDGRGTQDGWNDEKLGDKNPKVARRNILGLHSRVLGHGLLKDGRPIHVTLFP